MVEHRRTPGRGAFVPGTWLIVVSILACVAAAGWIGYRLVVDDAPTDADAPLATSTPSSTTPATKASPTTSASEPEDSPTPTESPTPATERTASVSVLNNTGIGGLASTYAGRVQQAGWTVAGTGNWRGQIVSNTVYFPDGFEPQARLLARDLGIQRVMPSISPMRTDRLTVILSGPQQ